MHIKHIVGDVSIEQHFAKKKKEKKRNKKKMVWSSQYLRERSLFMGGGGGTHSNIVRTKICPPLTAEHYALPPSKAVTTPLKQLACPFKIEDYQCHWFLYKVYTLYIPVFMAHYSSDMLGFEVNFEVWSQSTSILITLSGTLDDAMSCLASRDSLILCNGGAYSNYKHHFDFYP